MTNREWLMSLPDEELCRYLKGCEICDNNEFRKQNDYACITEPKADCDFGHFEWLKSPHKENK